MENTKELNTPDTTVPRVEMDVPTGEGVGNDASKVVSLAELLNQEWGTQFKDDATALKGLKDNRLAGKLGKYRPYIEQLESTRGGENQALKYMENIINQPEAPQTPASPATPAVDANKFISKEQYERDMWLSKNPTLADYAPVLDALKATNPGKSYDEVKELPAFKMLFDKASEADEMKNNRAPLTSSSRVVNTTPNADYDKAFAEAKTSKDPERWAKFMAKNKSFSIPKGLEDM